MRYLPYAASKHRQTTYQVRTLIFGRDNYICWICGDKADPSAKWPDPRSPTLDHIIPLSKGGADHPNNVACAHAGCNRRKWDSILAVPHPLAA